MPSWITHLVTADRVINKVKVIDNNSFFFGNIMPDILNNYIVKKTNAHREYYITHFTKDVIINGIKYEFPDPDKFLEKYKKEMNNPIICGYYIHLLTDYFWNKVSYENYFKENNGLVEIKLKDGTKQNYEFEVAIRLKQVDFKMFTDFLKNNNNIQKINYSEDLVNLSNEIKEIPLTREDIENTLIEVDKFIYEEKAPIKTEYQLFTQDILNMYFEESIAYIIEKLNSIGE